MIDLNEEQEYWAKVFKAKEEDKKKGTLEDIQIGLEEREPWSWTCMIDKMKKVEENKIRELQKQIDINYIKDLINQLDDEQQVNLVSELAEKWVELGEYAGYKVEMKDESRKIWNKSEKATLRLTGPAAVKEKTDTRKTYTEWLEEFSKDGKSVIEVMKPLQEHQNHMTFMNEIRGELVYIANMLGVGDHPLTRDVEKLTVKVQEYINNYGNTE